MLKFLEKLLDFIFCSKCYICHKDNGNELLCDECFKKLRHNKLQLFYNKYNDLTFYSSGIYEEDLKKLILALKFRNQKGLAKYLGKYMYDYWCRLNIANKNFKIVAVPQYHKTNKPYNHAQEIASEFAKLAEIECDFSLIKRVKKTKPQYKLTKEERVDNLKDAFILTKDIEKDVTYIIIDDIITTSSTVNEMRKTLNTDNIIIYTTAMTEVYLK